MALQGQPVNTVLVEVILVQEDLEEAVPVEQVVVGAHKKDFLAAAAAAAVTQVVGVVLQPQVVPNVAAVAVVAVAISLSQQLQVLQQPLVVVLLLKLMGN